MSQTLIISSNSYSVNILLSAIYNPDKNYYSKVFLFVIYQLIILFKTVVVSNKFAYF